MNNNPTLTQQTPQPVLPTVAAQTSALPLIEAFEPGLEVVWLCRPRCPDGQLTPPDLRIPAEVVAVGRRRVQIAIQFEDGFETRVWVRPESLRIRCVECHMAAAMPKSQTCAACWSWSMALDFDGLVETR
jgi:hypothetical protein